MDQFVHVPLDEDDIDIFINENAALVFTVRTSASLVGIEPEGELVDLVESVINEIRPYVTSDGGEVELIGVRDGYACLTFGGNCGSCSLLGQTTGYINEYVREHVPGIEGIEIVHEGLW